ncbi:MAG: hypothetical protein UGF43_01535 [Blautia sp.]|uniref:hypothetical protein n=1 Tax=Blautia sp. TaxID=1955243 RepID=UPI002E79E6A4|nr:hypothetical protein [Blautia sp.]MEE1442293.1 hypothetical protein [Blautia sp.]
MKQKSGNPYEDILELPHPVSKTHPQMPRGDRAAQFAPFAALTGYEEAVREAARLTEEKMILDEDSKEQLDWKLRCLQEKVKEKPTITVTYFLEDEKKKGGKYVTVTGVLKKMDSYTHQFVLENGEEIPLEDIVSLEFENI